MSALLYHCDACKRSTQYPGCHADVKNIRTCVSLLKLACVMCSFDNAEVYADGMWPT